VYVRAATEAEQRAGQVPVTQFGRMCEKLGIRIIAASSPQAKGRVERAHGTHQDRLVKKLRLAEIADYDDANRYLGEHYIAEHNRRYARPAAEAADYHRRRPTARQLDQVFWLEEERVVSEDWVVGYKNRLLQLQRQSQHWAPCRKRVLVRENETGQIQIRYREQCLPFREVLHASTARSEGRGVECTLGLRHEVKGVVAVRCKIIVRQCGLLRIVPVGEVEAGSAGGQPAKE
jgi:hypothetical protein